MQKMDTEIEALAVRILERYKIKAVAETQGRYRMALLMQRQIARLMEDLIERWPTNVVAIAVMLMSAACTHQHAHNPCPAPHVLYASDVEDKTVDKVEDAVAQLAELGQPFNSSYTLSDEAVLGQASDIHVYTAMTTDEVMIEMTKRLETSCAAEIVIRRAESK